MLRFDPGEHPVALQLGGSDPDGLARVRRARRGLRLRRDQPQLRLPVRPRAEPALRRLPDARRRDAGRRLRRGDARRDVAAGDGQAPHRRRRLRGIRRSCAPSSTRSPTPAATCSSCTRARPGSRASRRRRTARSRRCATRLVYRLKQDFPQLHDRHQRRHPHARANAPRHLRHVDGVMLGREAYENPYLLAEHRRRAVRRRRVRR